MNFNLFNRTWISPITSITFIVVGITGVFLTFDIKSGGIKALHQWIGYAFTLAGFIHLAVNRKAFMAHFRERSAILAAFAGVIISLAVFYAGEVGGKQQRTHPLMQALDANANGVIDADDIAMAGLSLRKLDTNKDGLISVNELLSKNATPVKHLHN